MSKLIANTSGGQSTPLQWGRRVNTAEWPVIGDEDGEQSRLQWGRRVNTAECTLATSSWTLEEIHASMGPPREHGGMTSIGSFFLPKTVLQWGRRVNTAEWLTSVVVVQAICPASMGPPREHGGMLLPALEWVVIRLTLQWGRRVNTAEWSSRQSRAERSTRFNGAAA